MTEDNLALGDIKVLEISEEVAGPFCAKLVAGLGAEVIKVERPGSGDLSRRIGPFPNDEPHPEKSASFLYLNTGKKSVTLNLESEAGASILRRMAQECDILVESFPPGHMDQLGLGYSHLESLNPGIIYTSVSPFGQTGPYRDYKGSDIIAQAAGGLMQTIGTPDGEPLKVGGNSALYTTGISAFSATMLALYDRDTKGHGQHVDVSAVETMAVAQIHSSIQYQFQGVDRTRTESTLVRAQDGWVNPGLTAGVGEDIWARVCDMMGKPELADDPHFDTRQARRAHEHEMLGIIGEWAATQPKEEIYHLLQGQRTIAGYVATVEDLFTSRQLVHRSFFQPIVHPYTGELMYPGAPFAVEGQTWKHSRAPLLGEHNEEVYSRHLGYTREELIRLFSLGVI